MVSLRIDERRPASNSVLAENGDTATGHDREELDSLYCVGEVRILILDDDTAVSRVIQTALARTNFTVDSVSDPLLMEAQLKEKPYHVVVLDYVIPGLQSDQ